MENFPICQVVGYKNSGKTTLMQQLIRYFTEQDLHVGTLKHHGHGGEPGLLKETDSYKHLHAGAAISAVQGEQQFQLTINDVTAFSLDQLIEYYRFSPVDILLIEGYKQADFPKIILVNVEQDLQLLDRLTNVLAVGSRNQDLLTGLQYPTFSLLEMDVYLPRLAALITD